MVLANMARVLAVIGNFVDAERLAKQSVKVLENFYPPNEWVLLRPLQILASIQLGSGRTARAREVLRRMQSIPIERPEDGAIVHATMGELLQIEGKRSDAEAEYKHALRAWEEAGRGESTDAAVILHCLGALYLREQRLDEARRTLDRALVIHDRAKDALPIDRLVFLQLRGALHARLGERQQAEQDLRDALAIADRQPYVDPDLLRSILESYSFVLRTNHHRREARSIEARKAALPTNRTDAVVVDSTQLRLEGKAAKKESVH
jgi:tetratricopeptide (TPR) repeat protein